MRSYSSEEGSGLLDVDVGLRRNEMGLVPENLEREIDDGGPAFPVPDGSIRQGMSLRDWFAGMVICGDRMADAGQAYLFADRFIEERKKRG